MLKIVFIFVIIIALGTAALLALNLRGETAEQPTSALPGHLRSLGYEVDVKDVTFRGHQSQNISAEKDETSVLVQAVSGVEEDTAQKILEELHAPVLETQKDISTFNPYIAQEVTLSVPEALRPVKKETTVQGASIDYYLVNTNAIFSMMIYSEPEVRYKGLFTTYFCPEDNMAHKLEIYYPAQDDFDEERALNVLSSLYCT